MTLDLANLNIGLGSDHLGLDWDQLRKQQERV